MDFYTAYQRMVQASVEQDTVEIPAILQAANFGGKECLEVGPGPLARMAIKLSSFAKHITVLEEHLEILPKIQAAIKEAGLSAKIDTAVYEGISKEKFPFPDKTFDIAYGAWLPHKTLTDERFLDEMMRVSRKHVLLLFPGINGDEPDLVSIVRPGEANRRAEYRMKVIDYFRKKGHDVKIKDNRLQLVFRDEQDIREVFYQMAFHGKPLIDEEKVDRTKEVNGFLDRRVKRFVDGFYVLTATSRT